MDPALKKCDYCGFMPNTVAHQERSEPLERRIADLEAEVERLRGYVAIYSSKEFQPHFLPFDPANQVVKVEAKQPGSRKESDG